MIFPRNSFLIDISNLNKEGTVKDLFTKDVLLKIVNKSKNDILSRVVNFMSFRFIGKMEWDFIFGEQPVIKIEKKVFDTSIYIKYNFNNSFYNLYRVDVINSIFPFSSVFSIYDSNGVECFRCKKDGVLDYKVVDNKGIVYATINKSSLRVLKEEYYVSIERLLDSYQNYIFLSLPVIISVFD
ncbi:MAG: hypothetical protein RMJ36_01755 [Candidatus Calescibacterium sp.]|nr:hypothetical protein [Candidatus Calescibacterium sp.]MDW8132363.1 hypothetical protein [Candidatus Calescibacterium sp.]